MSLDGVFNLAQTLFAFLLVLGALIFIHEFGHFFMAKLFGIRVEVFSLGFGPRLLGWKRGHTDYRVSAFPLGGYVKMLGENPDEGGELSGSKEEFLSRSKPVRFAILFMGAGMNLVLAVVLYWVIFVVGLQTLVFLEAPGVVGFVRPASPAATVGLQPGDVLLAFGDRETPSWQEFDIQVKINPNKETTVTILRDGEEMTLPIKVGTPPLDDERSKYDMGDIGIEPQIPILVQTINADSPASRGGMQVGDEIYAVEGQRALGSYPELIGLLTERVRSRAGQPMVFTVLRDGRQVDLSIVPEEFEGKGRIQVSWGWEVITTRYSPWDALRKSIDTNLQSAGLLFQTLKNMKIFGGTIGTRAMSGPVDIAKFSGQAFRSGWRSLLTFMAMVSLQLGILNLLPIPVLDGGHIFVLLLEGVLRRDFSMQIKERMMQVGFLFLITLMGVILSMDIIKNAVG